MPVKGWRRHLDGWQAGLLAVTIAATGAVLGVPRAVAPAEVPEPAVQPEALAASLSADEARAEALETNRLAGKLAFDVRALGSAVRAFGEAEAETDGPRMEAAHREATMAAAAALTGGPDDVLALRSHQALAFVREVRALAQTGVPSAELVALGGGFADMARRFGWWDPAERRLLPSEAVLRALFKKRWNDITSLHGPVFALALDEERALGRFLLTHPPVVHRPPALATPAGVRAQRMANAVADDQKRIDKIRELGALDPSYPAAFAEGVVLFRLGRFELAAQAFERHLAAHPDGPWTLRARNHLKASLEAR